MKRSSSAAALAEASSFSRAVPHVSLRAGPVEPSRMRSPAARRSAVLRDLNLTSNQVWGLAKTDRDWATELEAALTAMRRDDLKHGTNAAYVAGCVCRECREHQRKRMAGNRQLHGEPLIVVRGGKITPSLSLRSWESPDLTPRPVGWGAAGCTPRC
jgi:hypothetical protein